VFRSRDDFDDWLENPYHSREERQYLIKLDCDFVNDLRSPKVLCYRTTALKQKKYDNGVVYQFKLEKVMDYGPNIAGAFASFDPKEVTKLRNEIYEVIEWQRTGKPMTTTPSNRQPNYAESSRVVASQNNNATNSNNNSNRISGTAFDFGSI